MLVQQGLTADKQRPYGVLMPLIPCMAAAAAACVKALKGVEPYCCQALAPRSVDAADILQLGQQQHG
jgi:hypothetical protein